MFLYRGPEADKELALEKLWTSPLIAIDTETVSLIDRTCIGIGLYISDNEGFYFPTYPHTDQNLPRVMGLLGDQDRTKIYHNGMFDLGVLDQLSWDEGLTPPDDTNIEDTSIKAQVEGLPPGLQRLGEEWLGYSDMFSIQDLFLEFKTKSMLDVPWEKTGEKCLNDCRTTWALLPYLKGLTNERRKACYNTDRRLVSVLRRTQSKGLQLRPRVLQEYEVRLRKDTSDFERECEYEGFNPGSNQQVGYVLATRGNILPLTDSRKQLRVNEEVLEECEDELAPKILDYRRKAKLLSTYVMPFMTADRAYTHFRIDLSTGRLASSGMKMCWHPDGGVCRNLQNVPPDLRSVFNADHHQFVWADYSQIELRVLAYMSQDKEMMANYADGRDLHETTRVQGGFPDRGPAKTFNFAMVYGASDRVLIRRTGLSSDQVRILRGRWKSLYSGASQYMTACQYGTGDWVESDFGRRMRLPEIQEGTNTNPRKFESHVQKCRINFPIQGTAADIIKQAMVRFEPPDLRLQVHDELVNDGPWEPPEELAHIHPELATPFETKRSVSWS